MKNKFQKVLSYAILVVLLCTTNFAFAQNPQNIIAMKATVVKFTLAMLAIVVFSVVIFVGLSLYNKFFVASQVKDYKLNRDSLRTPSDSDEAVIMFITKNRLK